MTNHNPQYGPGPYGYGPSGSEGQPKPKKRRGLKVLLVIVGLFALLGLCSVAVSGESEDESTAGQQVGSSESAPEVSAPEPAEEAEPDVPREYQNALKSAQSYVDLMPFSYQGLYDQLTSEYADKYTPEAAQYAVDNVDADWNAEAVEAAESYLDTMPFSREELISQLSSEYADKFTVEQAQAAVNQVY